MYVCVCNAITERQVRRSVESGSTTLADLQFDLGVATCCGCCAETACQYLPAGAGGCEHAYETAVAAPASGAAEVETVASHAATRRFPVGGAVAKAA